MHIFAVKSFSVVWIKLTQTVCQIKIPEEVTEINFDFLKLLKDSTVNIMENVINNSNITSPVLPAHINMTLSLLSH